VWGELWAKVLKQMGVHTLSEVPDEMIEVLSEECRAYLFGMLEYIARKERISNNKKHKKDNEKRRSKRGR